MIEKKNPYAAALFDDRNDQKTADVKYCEKKTKIVTGLESTVGPNPHGVEP